MPGIFFSCMPHILFNELADNIRLELYHSFSLKLIGGNFLTPGNYACLGEINDYWEEIGFTPWAKMGLTGVYRRVTFKKGALLGEVARYYADDYIIWGHRGEESVAEIFREWKGETDVMTHRVLLLGQSTWENHRQKTFLWGYRGWVEVYTFRIGDEPHKRFRDLAHWASMGLEYAKVSMGKNQAGGDVCQVS
jgi:hypothetical protein